MVRPLKAALRALWRTSASHAAPLVWSRRRGASLVVIMYHRVLPRAHPARLYEQPGMIVAPETLAMNIRVLQQHFSLMHLEEWVRRSREGEKLPRLACAVTFDDGWRDNYEFAYPVLRRMGAPATIYLVSAMLGGNYWLWPTRLASMLFEAWSSGNPRFLDDLRDACPQVSVPATVASGLEGEAADRVLAELKAGFSDEQMKEIVLRLDQEGGSGGSPELLGWEDLHEMSATGLIKYGSHTRTHMRLGDGPDAGSIEREVKDSRSELQESLGVPITGFCYPNGDYSNYSVAQVRKHYEYAVTTRHGWNSPASDPCLLRRIGLHDDVCDTRAKLLSRIATGY